jgi:hypothetical protein
MRAVDKRLVAAMGAQAGAIVVVLLLGGLGRVGKIPAPAPAPTVTATITDNVTQPPVITTITATPKTTKPKRRSGTYTGPNPTPTGGSSIPGAGSSPPPAGTQQ